MDREGNGHEPAFPAAGLVWLFAIFAGFVLFKELPWRATRPASDDPKPFRTTASQDVDARLWQDPFTAVARARAAEQPAPGDALAALLAAGGAAGPEEAKRRHSAAELHRDAQVRCEEGTRILPVAVMVSGGPYWDYAEFRRRARYAALAGLHRAGFSPSDAEHLGYFVPEPERGATGIGTAARQLPAFVAFEWLDERPPTDARQPGGAAKAARGTTALDKPTAVLLLWMDEDVFYERTVAKLRHIVGSVLPAGCAVVDAAPGSASGAQESLLVVGPMSSDVLRSMVRTPPDNFRDITEPLRVLESREQDAWRFGMTFYAYGSTVKDARILDDRGAAGTALPGAVAEVISARWRRGGHETVAVLRTIGTDDALAEALAGELVRRRVLECPPTRSGSHCIPRRDTDDTRRHIVLVGERDGQYGQALSSTFADAFAGRAADRPGSRSTDQSADRDEWIHRFTYLRGLDGQAPGTESGRSGTRGEGGSQRGQERGGGSAGSPADIERAEGQAQVDYLRRMAAQISDVDDGLRSGGKGRIGAIGILGNDVHDKLLILQALRPRFPDAIFFTTDLDARLVHPGEMAAARNLLVASSFGLSLRDACQGDIAPFRDGYQTSIFLSMQIAVAGARPGALWTDNDKCLPRAAPPAPCATRALHANMTQCTVVALLGTPRLFEVGRTGIVEYASDMDAQPGGAEQPATSTAAIVRTAVGSLAAGAPQPAAPGVLLPIAATAGVAAVHPEVPSLYPSLSDRTLRATWGLLVLGVLAAMAFSPLGPATARFVTGQAVRTAPALDPGGTVRPVRPVRAFAVGLGVALCVGLVAFLFVKPQTLWRPIADWLTEYGEGEPIGLLDGVSVWPTEALRLVALVLSIWFLRRGWRLLKDNEREVTEKLGIDDEHATLRADLERDRATWPWWLKIGRMFAYRIPTPVASGLWRSDRHADVTGFWLKYLYQGRGVARLARVVAVTAVFVLCATAFLYLEGMPATPSRGGLAHRIDLWLSVGSGLAALLLVFFVVDATVFCDHFIDELHHNPRRVATAEVPGCGPHGSRWPAPVLERYGRKFAITQHECLDYWIGVRFVALRTRAVVRLVWGPFIVLGLLITSNNVFFDHWSVTTSLLVVASGCVLIVVACAVRLRMRAEAFRRKAVWRLANEIVRLRGSEDEAHRRSAEQLEKLVEQVRAFRAGAFAPYSQQPVLRAMLLPLTGLGGPVLMDQLAIWNL